IPALYCIGSSIYSDLHPLPTRRSSDLVYYTARTRTYARPYTRSWTPTRDRLFRQRGWVRFGCTSLTEARTTSTVWVGCSSGRRRSEEHTSELQSRFDLVCRLLLEKKKK